MTCKIMKPQKFMKQNIIRSINQKSKFFGFI